jgi:putative addiction module antidote
VALFALRLQKLGNSVGVLLPQEVLVALNVGPGDALFLTESPGGYRITPYDLDFERQMGMAQKVMKRDHNLLCELAKK